MIENKVIYSMSDVGMFYPPNSQVLRDISLGFYYGAKIGVLGRNGAGKSTLLRVMAGEDKEFDGEACLADGFTVGYVPQEPRLNEQLDVKGNVDQAVGKKRQLLDRFHEINMKLAEDIDADQMQKLCDQLAQVQDQVDTENLWELDRHIEVAMDAMNLPPGDADVTNLSGGERRRVALCKVLLQQPDLLLLDEPTNHLDTESAEKLTDSLGAYNGTLLFVSHNLAFAKRLSTKVWNVAGGKVED